mmetsp:Transcript_33250/g.75228  ORF Transcript_33250/g.75228 Transcript_33250/m.75228 type:complete len:83 (+) Transcript_33250:279-527(+)
MEAETLIKKEMLNQELIESERLERECIGAEKQSGLNWSYILSCSKRTKSGRETRVRAPKSRDRDIRRGGNNRRRETADERLE